MSSEKDYTSELRVVSNFNELLYVSKHNGRITLDWSMPGEEDFHISMSMETAEEFVSYLKKLLEND